MFKKILIATDASIYSRHAVTAAIDIAKKYNASIKLIHVIKPLPYSSAEVGSQFFEITAEQSEKIGKEVMGTTLKDIDTQGIEIETMVVIGYPANDILSESEKGYDLIVMGTRGHSSIGGAILGSVTQRVLGEAKCPVLIVK